VNAVPLIPLDEAGKIRAPTDDELNYFKPYTLALIHELNPEFIVCLGKTAAKLYGLDIPPGSVKGNIGFCHHPAYYLRNSTDGKEDFASVIKKIINENIINFTVEYSDCDFDFAIKDFLEKIGAKYNA
jgi:uracil-DNA glycosylase